MLIKVRPRLIVVDGPPGAGKSMCSQVVADQLVLHGQPVRWLEEHVIEESTFAALAKAFERNDPALLDCFADCWQKLLSEIAESGQIYVMDGALFADSTQWLWASEIPDDAIAAALARVYELAGRLDPFLVYLCGDPRRLMQRAVDTRGQVWAELIAGRVEQYPYQRTRARTGVEGMFQYFIDGQSRFRELLRSCSFRQLHIDTTRGDWNSYVETVMTALDLEVVPTRPVRSAPELEQYAGTYQPPSTWPTPYCLPFNVHLTESGELRLDLAHLGGMLLSPLSSDPRSSTFAMRGKAWTMEFARAENGEVTGAIWPFLTGRHVCPKITTDLAND